MSVSTSRATLGEYTRSEKLGEGTYGVVYKCLHVPTGNIVALKKIKMNNNHEEGIPSTTLREVSLLKHLKHPCIVDLRRSLYIDGALFLIFEFMDTDLHKYIVSTKAMRLRELKRLSYQLIESVRFCHANRVLHRDLKPPNLLIGTDGNLKMADFGLGREHGLPIGKLTHEVVTLWYRPPEIILGQQKYSGACDMWGVGCIIAEMATKRVYFAGDSEIDQIFKIFRILGTPNEDTWPGFKRLPQYKPSFPRWRAKDIYDEMFISQMSRQTRGGGIVDDIYMDKTGVRLVNQMLVFAPFKRITAKAALRHEWFDDIRDEMDRELQRGMDSIIETTGVFSGFVKGDAASIVGSKAGMPEPSKLRPVDANAQHFAAERSHAPRVRTKTSTVTATRSHGSDPRRHRDGRHKPMDASR